MWHQIDNLLGIPPSKHSHSIATRVNEVHLEIWLDAALLAQNQGTWILHLLILPLVTMARRTALFDAISWLCKWWRISIGKWITQLLIAEHLAFVWTVLRQNISYFWIQHLITPTQLTAAHEFLLRNTPNLIGQMWNHLGLILSSEATVRLTQVILELLRAWLVRMLEAIVLQLIRLLDDPLL